MEEILKWYGAVIATIALAWNIYNYLNQKPKVVVRLRHNTGYADKFSDKDGVDGSREYIPYCHFEFTNRGKLPTTIIQLDATHKKNKDLKVQVYDMEFEPISNKNLPFVLSPGEVWSCRFEMDRLYNLKMQGQPEVRVLLSHLNEPMLIKPTLPINKVKLEQKVEIFK